MYNRVRKVLEVIEQSEDYKGVKVKEVNVVFNPSFKYLYRVDVHWPERESAEYFHASLVVPGSTSRLLVRAGYEDDWLVQVWV